ncbi:elongation factor G [Inmirania thermothiophila]|uniref:Elongation factor G n=1 Tax=Inmirania thermothiophila TaxID=1750597 RepID=A0A3N1Y6L2_9GAMM|nr:elongation factor G [Inmirania thermothiophila]ROR34148.1 translation elongation factor 2 (EF-2/EF-G) [Inmirania thermothiophila]
MPGYTTAEIHNLALLGHAGAGKTLLAEALLHAAGAIPAMGSIERGTTVCDFEPEEQAHGHSLSPAVASCDWKGRHVNLVDTPGYPDFLPRAYAVLPAVETAVVVVDAERGIELGTRRAMEKAAELALPRVLVVNRIDQAGPEALAALVEALREAFGREVLPINLPARDGGVVDCFFSPGGEAAFHSVEAAHTEIVDQVVEMDEDLMALYLEQGEVRPEQLHEPFEAALREGHLIPLLFTSAATGAGIRELLDAIVELFPNPLEGNPRPFRRGAAPFHASHDPDDHVLAHVFRVTTDPFVGRLGIFRIHQGTVRPDSQLYVDDGRKPFRVGHLLRIQGKTQTEVDAGIPGDLCALAKIEELHYNAVLHDAPEDGGVCMVPVALPEPMQGLAVEPAKKGDDEKLTRALAALAAEDPSFRYERSPSTHETIIRGIGELHLRVILERMRSRHHLEVETRPPRIAYRETVRAAAEGHHRHKKQTGGAGQFGEVFLRIEPLERGAGFEFVNQVVGGAIPSQFIPAVEKGVRQAMEEGALAGYPIQDVRVIVHDGKHHPVDSKEVAFVTAGKKAFLDAFAKARPVLLEPLVEVEVTAPEAHVGDITGNLSGRRGRIQGTESLPGGLVVVRAEAPLAEMADYASWLKSATGGHGSYTMSFSRYEPAPPEVQKAVVAERRAAETA